MNEQKNKEIKEIKKLILKCYDSLTCLSSSMRLDEIVIQSVLYNCDFDIGESELRDLFQRFCDLSVKYRDILENVSLDLDNLKHNFHEVLENA